MIPIRCFTCNKVIADKWVKYESLLQNGMKKDKALDCVGLSRYCCRRMFLGHVELIDQLLLFQEHKDNDFPKKSEKIFDE